MFLTSSTHRRELGYIDDWSDYNVINTQKFIHCLATHTGQPSALQEIEPEQVKNSRKRKDSHQNGSISRKRARLEPPPTAEGFPQTTPMPAFSHCFYLECTVPPPHEPLPEELENLLKTTANLSFPLHIHRENQHILAFTSESGNASKERELNSRLFALPAIRPPEYIDIQAYDYKRMRNNVLLAIAELCARGLASIAASFKIITARNPSLVFTLEVNFNVSLLDPTIFQPVNRLAQHTRDSQRLFLSHIFPAPTHNLHQSHFYSSLRPAPPLPLIDEDLVNCALQPPQLRTSLLPFQRRSLLWLLQREGKTIANGKVVDYIPSSEHLPLFWEHLSDHDFFFNRVTGEISRHVPEPEPITGGMLAEEVGLGKTLECIALILLNPYPDRHPINKRWDHEAQVEVSEVKTTLIVTPAQLSSQWKDEFDLHSPSLRVLLYQGWNKLRATLNKGKTKRKTKKKGKQRSENLTNARSRGKIYNEDSDYDPDEDEEEEEEDSEDWCKYLSQFDVVLVTYNILRSDLDVARAPIQRPRRDTAIDHYRERSKLRSPLVMVEWARVLMDEVQQVGGKAEEMVSLIPRLCSFAVSGTPARSKPYDLIHIMKFLRVGSACQNWPRLNQPGYAPMFLQIFDRLAIRTVKAEIKNELTIPPQHRYVVGVDLGRVERHIYNDTLQMALEKLGVDARGVATSFNWELDIASLRGWLRRLRQVCIHPQVGALQKKDRLGGGSLRTITQVLAALRDQNQQILYNDKKAKVQATIRLAQLTQKVSTDQGRYKKATEMLLACREEIQKIIVELEASIATHPHLNGDKELHSTENERGKGKARKRSLTPEDQPDLHSLPMTDSEREELARGRSRLRECKIILHRVMFLLGDVYNISGKTDAETDAYATAEDLRKAILEHAERAASRSIDIVMSPAERTNVTKNEMRIKHCGKGGIMSNFLLEEANEIIDILNEQTNLIFKWKAILVQLLTQKLSSSGDGDADGEEYARALQAQGECETYLVAYSSLLADRKEVLLAERTTLTAHEHKEKKHRKTKAALTAINEDDLSDIEADEVQDQILEQELDQQRKDIKEDRSERALRTMMVELNKVVKKAELGKKAAEAQIAGNEADELREVLSSQGQYMETLEAGLATLRKAFNARILYFRGLQELSDSVVEVSWEGDFASALANSETQIKDLEDAVDSRRRRQLYLDTMQEEHDQDRVHEDDRVCIICQCEFTRGFITFCAHVFCEGCLVAWRKRKDGQRCPVCRMPIKPADLHRIAIGPTEIMPVLSDNVDRTAPKPRHHIDYNHISSDLRESIQKVRARGEFGTKIMFLVRHLLLIQDKEPGSKSIVFSAWADSLHIIEQALTANGIPTLRLDSPKKNVAHDFVVVPDILVLLLHGERENAGLNVTCAKRVFLVEPVVNHAFEIQGIARVDRLGQANQTEVFCYFAQDTVEKNILDLAARQGKSLYTIGQAHGTLDSTQIVLKKQEIDAPVKKKQKGDFVAKAEDMLAVIFPHLYECVDDEALERFLADSDLQISDMIKPAFRSTAPLGSAAAGPSRLG